MQLKGRRTPRQLATSALLCGVLACACGQTSSRAGDAPGDETPETAQPPDIAGNAEAAEPGEPTRTATEPAFCSACLVIDRGPFVENLGEGDWVADDFRALSLMLLDDPDNVVEVPLSPPGHLPGRVAWWGPARRWFAYLHEEADGTEHLSQVDLTADYAQVEIPLPPGPGDLRVVRLGGPGDALPSVFTRHDWETDSHTVWMVEAGGSAEPILVSEGSDEPSTLVLDKAGGMLLKADSESGSSDRCPWQFWDFGLPVELQPVLEARCYNASFSVSADGRWFGVVSPTHDISIAESQIFDARSLEPVLTLPEASQSRISFAPEGGFFVQHFSNDYLIGDVGQSDRYVLVGNPETGSLEDPLSWGRAPLGDGVLPSDEYARLIWFLGNGEAVFHYDEYYRVSLTGGIWRGLGQAGGVFRVANSFGYTTDDSFFLSGDDFTSGTRISHELLPNETLYGAPQTYPGGLAYQTKVDNDPPEDAVYFGEGDEFRLYVALEGEQPRIPSGLPVSTSSAYSMRALGDVPGAVVYATVSYKPGDLYYVDAALQSRVLAREIRAVY